MLINNFCRTSAQLMARWIRPSSACIGILLVLLTASCQSLPSQLNTESSQSLTLTISQVSPGTGGSYRISGSSTLPNATQLTVAAIRYLNLDANAANSSANSSAPPTYVILDRQRAVVQSGAWESRLNLWQPSATGQLQETWQASSASATRSAVIPESVIPDASVTFLATLDPPRQKTDLKQQIESLSPIAQRELSRFTSDGELYIQASQVMAVPPPQSNAAIPNRAVPQFVSVPVTKPSANSTAAAPTSSTDQSVLPNAMFR